MTTLYDTLNISSNATDYEIKRAYRRLASVHHPDKGGAKEMFQAIQEAYDTLSDTHLRYEYDLTLRKEFYYTTDNIYEFYHKQTQRNKDISVKADITFLDSYTGSDIEIKFTCTSGEVRHVIVNIPAGVANGQRMSYSQLGDNSISYLPAGDLYVTINVVNDTDYVRKGNNIYQTIDVPLLTALTGGTIDVKSIDNSTLRLNIPAGTQPGTEYSVPQHGFYDINTRSKGSFNILINIVIPTIKDKDCVEHLTQILSNSKHS